MHFFELWRHGLGGHGAHAAGAPGPGGASACRPPEAKPIPNQGGRAGTVGGMICPRCGTVAAGQATTCNRCGGELDRARSRPRRGAEPPVPRAPTQRASWPSGLPGSFRKSWPGPRWAGAGSVPRPASRVAGPPATPTRLPPAPGLACRRPPLGAGPVAGPARRAGGRSAGPTASGGQPRRAPAAPVGARSAGRRRPRRRQPAGTPDRARRSQPAAATAGQRTCRPRRRPGPGRPTGGSPSPAAAAPGPAGGSYPPPPPVGRSFRLSRVGARRAGLDPGRRRPGRLRPAAWPGSAPLDRRLTSRAAGARRGPGRPTTSGSRSSACFCFSRRRWSPSCTPPRSTGGSRSATWPARSGPAGWPAPGAWSPWSVFGALVVWTDGGAGRTLSLRSRGTGH